MSHVSYMSVSHISYATTCAGEKPSLKTQAALQEERGQDLSLTAINGEEEVTKQDTLVRILQKRFRKGCVYLVRNPVKQ
jgi:hypothetical protein